MLRHRVTAVRRYLLGAVPAIPTGLAVVSVTDTTVALNWNDSSDLRTGDKYQIYINDTWANLESTTSDYTATGLTPGTTYTFRVSAGQAGSYGNWTAPVSATPTSPSTPAFVGDYAGNNYNQWDGVQTAAHNVTPGSAYTSNLWTYQMALQSDATFGYVNRVEVRDGDIVPATGSNERSEVAGDYIAASAGLMTYEFWIKFDNNFPAASGDAWWCITNQWHASASTQPNGQPMIAPHISFGQQSWFSADNWCLLQKIPQDQTNVVLWQTPLARGTWHKIKMQVNWSTSPSAGWIKLWHNDVAQTFIAGGTTWTGQTLPTGGENDPPYYKEGYYRSYTTTATGTVYHAGYKRWNGLV